MSVLFFISILGYAIFLFLWSNSRPEICLLAAVSGLMGVLYISGLVGILNITAYFLYYLGIIIFIVSLLLYLRNNRLGIFFSPGVFIYVISSIIFIFFYSQFNLQLWDEFSHWAIATKEMLFFHSFPSSYGTLIFKEYPIGINLLHYLAAVNINNSNVGIYYLAHFLLIIVLLIIFFSEISWRYFWLVIVFMLAFILILYTLSVYVCSLMVDIILSLFLSAGLFIVVRWDFTKYDLFFLIPVLFILPLIKNTGIFFAYIIIITFFICQGGALIRRSRLQYKKKVNTVMLLLVVLLAPFIAFQSWKIRINLLGIEPIFKTFSITCISVLKAFSSDASVHYRDICSNFIKALLKSPLVNYSVETERSFVQLIREFLILPAWIKPPQVGLIGWLGLVSLLYIAAILRYPRDKRPLIIYSLFLFFSFIYIFGLLLLYLFSFSEYEGQHLASFTRYINTMVISFMFSGLVFLIPIASKFYKENIIIISMSWRSFFYWLCLGVTFIGVLIQAPSFSGMPKWSSYGEASEEHNYLLPLTDEVRRLTRPDSRVFIITQNSAGRAFHISRYEIVPRSSNRWFFSLGKPYYEGDVWTELLTPSELSIMLKEEKFDYIFLERSDRQFWETYSELFSSIIDFRHFVIFHILNKQEEKNIIFLEPVK